MSIIIHLSLVLIGIKTNLGYKMRINKITLKNGDVSDNLFEV